MRQANERSIRNMDIGKTELGKGGVMRPIDQRVISNVNGDCFRACVASLLEVPYEDAFDLYSMIGASWMEAFFPWLKQRGFEFNGMFNVWNGKENTLTWEELRNRSVGIKGCFIGWGISPRYTDGTTHAVIVDGNGKVIHDPHPSKQGVNPVWEVYIIDRIIPMKSTAEGIK